LSFKYIYFKYELINNGINKVNNIINMEHVKQPLVDVLLSLVLQVVIVAVNMVKSI